MSGPANGKLELKKAKVYLCSKEKKFLLNAVVYIHVKGYALARVTHLDIEHEVLNNIIQPKSGEFMNIREVEGGIEIDLGKEKELELEDGKIFIQKIKVLHPFLDKILQEKRKTRTWVGGKLGGIYIGFKKEQIAMLEKIAKEKFKFGIEV